MKRIKLNDIVSLDKNISKCHLCEKDYFEMPFIIATYQYLSTDTNVTRANMRRTVTKTTNFTLSDLINSSGYICIHCLKEKSQFYKRLNIPIWLICVSTFIIGMNRLSVHDLISDILGFIVFFSLVFGMIVFIKWMSYQKENGTGAEGPGRYYEVFFNTIQKYHLLKKYQMGNLSSNKYKIIISPREHLEKNYRSAINRKI